MSQYTTYSFKQIHVDYQLVEDFARDDYLHFLASSAEVEANAEADKQVKETADKINQADSLIFQTEKQLTEFGDKLPADKKQPIEDALKKLKEAHASKDIAAIDAGMEELNTVFQAALQEMYNASQAQGGQPGGPEGSQADPNAGGAQGQPKDDGEVTDIDFEEVK